MQVWYVYPIRKSIRVIEIVDSKNKVMLVRRLEIEFIDIPEILTQYPNKREINLGYNITGTCCI